MTKTFFSSILILWIVSSFAQITGNQISVEGSATSFTKPDIVHLTLTVRKTNVEQKRSVEQLNEEVDKVTTLLKNVGFEKSTIKISDFRVESNSYRQDSEFAASCTLTMRVSLNRSLIDLFYKEIRNQGLSNLSIEFETSLSNKLEKEVREELINQSIKNAKLNAENIAKNLGVKLGSIKYASTSEAPQLNPVSLQFEKHIGVKDIKGGIDEQGFFEEFQIEEKELQEKIYLIFEISDK